MDGIRLANAKINVIQDFMNSEMLATSAPVGIKMTSLIKASVQSIREQLSLEKFMGREFTEGLKMPQRKTHEKIEKLILGRPFGAVDAGLDSPVKLLGRSHRKVLHSIPEAVVVGFVLGGGVRGAAAGVLHILADTAESGVNKKINKLTKNRGETKFRKKRKQKGRKKNQ